MKKTSILISYDYTQDPGTTGFYFLKAARALDNLEVYTLNDKLDITPDICLNIEPCPYPVHNPKSINVYYEIDNHINLGRDRNLYNLVDILYIAQPYFSGLYDHPGLGILPLAFDPDIHRQYPDEPKIYDVGMIGNATYPEREHLLDAIAKKYMLLRGRCEPGEPYARKLSQCKVLFNCSLDHDINMRFFESLGFGVPFITDRLVEQDIFKKDGIFFEDYADEDELMFKLHNIFDNYPSCKIEAEQSTEIARLQHSYLQRLNLIIRDALALRAKNPLV